MKIDESCIEHNALNCIRYIMDVGEPEDYFLDTHVLDDDDLKGKELMIMTIGQIHGVLKLTEALKMVVKV